MDNKIITEIFNQVHNVWWKKWRDKPLHKDSPEWEAITREAGEILKKFNHPLAVHLIQDLLDELEDRCRNGGKEKGSA